MSEPDDLMPGEPITWTGGLWELERPKQSKWRCYLIGRPNTPGKHTVIFTPTEGNEPNRFHRFMQRLAFGFHWVRDDCKNI